RCNPGRRYVRYPGRAASGRSGHRGTPPAAAAGLHPAVHHLVRDRGDAQGSPDRLRGHPDHGGHHRRRLDEVPEDLRLCARTLGASRLYTMLRVQIRSALPGILTGMRISMAGAWTSIVAAELIAATSGLGYLIQQAGDYLNTALVLSGIICVAVLALPLDACLRGLLLLAARGRRG